jgi:hypothetical protein
VSFLCPPIDIVYVANQLLAQGRTHFFFADL